MFGTGHVVHHHGGVFRRVFEEQASIYMDACFLLAAVDANNSHRETVFDLLEEWGEKKIMVGYSNHVFHEVTNILLKNSVLKAMELAFLKFHTSSFYRKKWERLTPEEQLQIGDESIARALVAICNRLYPDRIMKRHNGDSDLFVNVQEILKEAKGTLHDRFPLHGFYHDAVDKFQQIIQNLKTLGMEVEHLESDEEIYTTSKQFMRLFQLEPTDALHLAITKYYGYDYLVTLDGDFVHNLYDSNVMEETKIYKIGA